MGSAALSHLRIPAVVAVGLLCFILVIAVGDASGPALTVPLQTSQIDPSVDGVVTVAVELEAGHVGPGDALDLDGAAVELPVTRSTLLLKASLGSNYAVRFRVGETWSDWSHLLGESDEAPDASPGTERAMGPLRVDEGADLMELVLTAGTDRSIEALFLLDVDPGSGADPRPTVAGTQQSRGVERPAIVPRSGWEAAGWASGNDGCEDGPWYADNIQAVVVHHTVTTNNYGPEEVDDLMRAVYYGHVNVNGWCDIGYNFVVDRFGTVWEGRTGGRRSSRDRRPCQGLQHLDCRHRPAGPTSPRRQPGVGPSE